jgi:hypothetical protein
VTVKETRVTYVHPNERTADGTQKQTPGMQGIEFPSLLETRAALTESLGVTDWADDVQAWLDPDGDQRKATEAQRDNLLLRQIQLEAELQEVVRKLDKSMPY